ncbi:MAG: amidohydrolase family protein [Planctomycetota bacterium]|nr:amidohydrolase family protein [Planctomycetota bacterium]MDG2144515.1 amidohydrolase family protein [Planctomycetota bacterium]
MLNLLANCLLTATLAVAPGDEALPAPGEIGGPDLTYRAAKILTMALEGPMVVNNGVVVVRDGLVAFVGKERDLPASENRVVTDLGDLWLMPGMIDLHTHESGMSLYQGNDLNDTVYLTNPGLRASAAVLPGNSSSMRAASVGVTTVLYIPGSGSNMGGSGVLLKTGFDKYEDCELRNPGSLKLAQSGNPESWVMGVNRSFMNWNTRNTFKRGLAYAAKWAAYEDTPDDEKGEAPLVDPQWELFRALAKGEAQVSTHTQIYQVVLETLTMVRQEFGLDVYIDHGTIGAWRLGGMAEELGVQAIIGPRNVDAPSRNFMRWAGHIEAEGFRGVAAGYQEAGHKWVGFNTDAPVISDEEYVIQAAMAVRFGFDDSTMDAVRGLTIVPAVAAGVQDKVGSIEVGKHADLILINGHPADPRSRIEQVLIEGRKVFDRNETTSADARAK